MHYTRPKANSPKLSPRNAFGQDTRQVLMLQAMYQVTHQRRVYKEFFYQLIEYLDAKWADGLGIDGPEFIRHIHQMADDDLDALGVRDGDGLDTGTGVPHFAFNLLDYKLWRRSEIEGRSPEGLPVVRASGFRFGLSPAFRFRVLPASAACRSQTDSPALGSVPFIRVTLRSQRGSVAGDGRVDLGRSA
jgi:hypothetical protein